MIASGYTSPNVSLTLMTSACSCNHYQNTEHFTALRQLMKSSKESSARYSAEIRKLSEQRTINFGPIDTGLKHPVQSAPGIHLPEHSGFSLSRKLKVYNCRILVLLVLKSMNSREREL